MNTSISEISAYLSIISCRRNPFRVEILFAVVPRVEATLGFGTEPLRVRKNMT